MSKRKSECTPEVWTAMLSRQNARRAANAEKIKAQAAAWHAANRAVNGEKLRAKTKAYYRANRQKVLAQKAARYVAEPELRESKAAYKKAYYAANGARVRAKATAWARENPEKHNATTAKHRAAKLQRTPAWADRSAIEAVYDLRAFCNKIAGPAHVDHWAPLQGDTVSGLHVHQNLQVLPGTENLAKGNRFEFA